jgi:hypothetical protein
VTDHQRKTEQHEQANRECAELILKDAARYGGEGAGLVMWARMVVDRGRERLEKNWRLTA